MITCVISGPWRDGSLPGRRLSENGGAEQHDCNQNCQCFGDLQANRTPVAIETLNAGRENVGDSALAKASCAVLLSFGQSVSTSRCRFHCRPHNALGDEPYPELCHEAVLDPINQEFPDGAGAADGQQFRGNFWPGLRPPGHWFAFRVDGRRLVRGVAGSSLSTTNRDARPNSPCGWRR